MRSLIVDDDFATRVILKDILVDFGDCDICVDGEEAVAAFKMALDKGKPYDVVFMDILMPKMDGIQALRAIRQIERQYSIRETDEVRAVMISVVDEVKPVVASFWEGHAYEYITKPVEVDKVLDVLTVLGLP